MSRKTSGRRSPLQQPDNDLAGHYRKIGITAVAAAVEYQGERMNPDRRDDDRMKGGPAARRQHAGGADNAGGTEKKAR